MKKLLYILIFLTGIAAKAQHPVMATYCMNNAGGFDPDAKRYMDTLTAAGATLSDVKKKAIDTLFRDLKGRFNPRYTTYNVYSRFSAMYILNHGTAACNKWNAIDPRDRDSSFRLSFAGAVVHNTTGLECTATGRYANTFWVPSARVTLSPFISHSYLFYNNNPTIGSTSYDMGASGTNDQTNGLFLSAYRAAAPDHGAIRFYANATANISGTPASIRGLYQFYVNGSNAGKTDYYFNGSLRLTGSTTNSTNGMLPTLPVYLGAINWQGNTPFGSGAGRRYPFAAIMTGSLSPSEIASIYNAVNNYLTATSSN